MKLTEARERIEHWANCFLDASILSKAEEDQHGQQVKETLALLPEWIAVTDRLPELAEPYEGGPLSSDNVLVFKNRISMGKLAQTYGRMKWNDSKTKKVTDPATRKTRWEGPGGFLIDVAYWMPFPAPPDIKAGADHHFLEYECGKCQCGRPKKDPRHF